jgi:hypothetical protein
MDNNKTQSVIHQFVTTLPADKMRHNQSSASSTAAITGTDDHDTMMAKRSQASTLPPPPREWKMTKHNQSSVLSPLPCQRTNRFYCASAKLPLPPAPN